MAQTPVARRYARALFDLAQEQHCLDSVQADLMALAQLGQHRAEYDMLLERYALTAENRKTVWDEILKGKAHPLTLRFVHFLVDKRRGGSLGSIIQSFNHLWHEARGITAIEILAARPLAEDQVQALVKKFAAKLGQKITATQKTDPSLLGGFQVRVGDVVHDYSVSNQLEKLHHKLATA